MSTIINAGAFFLLAIILLILSFRSFKHKEFLINNAYLYASKTAREKMDKNPYYRQSAITCLLLGINFLLSGIDIIWPIKGFNYVAICLAVITVIYAIISSRLIAIKKRNK